MRFQLSLTSSGLPALLPANYQYPLSSAIYKIIQHADENYSTFLHDEGYRHHGKSFKLFTFSDLQVPFRNQGDRLLLTGNTAYLLIAFHVDMAASNFIKGLFMNQQLLVTDKISGSTFNVTQVQLMPDVIKESTNSITEAVLQPLSPLVVGRKNNKGNYDFLAPDDPEFSYWLIHNWIEKYKAIADIEPDETALRSNISIQVLPQHHPIKSRLITIKAFTREETKIRGYTKFRLKVKAPKPMLELALNAGLGLYNAQGMGCVGV